MWGEVFLAAETNEASPPCVAFDADGNPTADGRAAAGGVAGFGGHKGYGPAFAIRSRAARCRITGFCFWLSIPARFCPGTRLQRRCRNW
jgi:hypothetical protein